MEAAVVLLCGIPGAGKTTFAKKLEALQYKEIDGEKLSAFAPRVVVERLSFDDLYGSTTAAFDPERWKKTQDEMAKIVKERLSQRSDQPDNACLVLLVDDNFYYRSMRKRFYHVADYADCGFGIVHVATPEDVCRRRNAARDAATRVPEEQFEKMVRAFEAPDPSFSFESNVVIIEDAAVVSCDLVTSDKSQSSRHAEVLGRVLCQATISAEAKHVERAMESDRLRQQVEDQKLTAESIVHSFDLASRKWISAVLNGDDDAFVVTGSKEKATLAKMLNQRRKALLTKTKTSATDAATPAAGVDPMQLLECFRADMIREFSEA